MKVGKDVEDALAQVEEWAVEGIEWLAQGLNSAG